VSSRSQYGHWLFKSLIVIGLVMFVFATIMIHWVIPSQIKPGQVWRLNGSDPFYRPFSVTVLGTSNDYVQFRYDWGGTNSSHVSSFLRAFNYVN